MKVATKLGSGYLLLILVFGGLLLVYQRAIQRTISVGREIATVDSRVLLSSSVLLDLHTEATGNGGKFRITGQSGYLAAFRNGREAVGDSIAALERLPLRGGQREAVRKLVEDWDALERRFALRDVDAASDFITSATDEEWDSFAAASTDLGRRMRDLRSVSRTVVMEDLDELAGGAEQTADTAVMGLLAAIVVAGVLAIWILRSIAGPIRRLEAGAAAVAAGDFDARIGLDGKDELSRLARSFDSMTEQLGEIERTKSDFLGKISHDLKTPLASIREVKRLLLDEVPGELTDKQRRLLELGLANADRLSAMIERLLEVARLEAGVEEYDVEPVNLGDVCTETVERWAGARTSNVTVRGPDAPLVVDADRFALQRVLENLLENAEDHGGGGSIAVTVSRESDQTGAPVAVVRVADDGPGIPADRQTDIFEAFARGDLADPGKGHVGLGLAICREIVLRHGGQIRVDDVQEGSSGAVFTFSLAAHA